MDLKSISCCMSQFSINSLTVCKFIWKSCKWTQPKCCYWYLFAEFFNNIFHHNLQNDTARALSQLGDWSGCRKRWKMCGTNSGESHLLVPQWTLDSSWNNCSVRLSHHFVVEQYPMNEPCHYRWPWISWNNNESLWRMDNTVCFLQRHLDSVPTIGNITY